MDRHSLRSLILQESGSMDHGLRSYLRSVKLLSALDLIDRAWYRLIFEQMVSGAIIDSK